MNKSIIWITIGYISLSALIVIQQAEYSNLSNRYNILHDDYICLCETNIQDIETRLKGSSTVLHSKIGDLCRSTTTISMSINNFNLLLSTATPPSSKTGDKVIINKYYYGENGRISEKEYQTIIKKSNEESEKWTKDNTSYITIDGEPNRNYCSTSTIPIDMILKLKSIKGNQPGEDYEFSY